MYVNDYTVDIGRKGKDGLLALQKMGIAAGLFEPMAIEMVDM
jgi:predicted solute-binding protein